MTVAMLAEVVTRGNAPSGSRIAHQAALEVIGRSGQEALPSRTAATAEAQEQAATHIGG
jgi:hypothetical protein